MNTMIAPEYVDTPAIDRIPLTGRVLIFGSGQLTHERLFFDFSSVTEVRTYDPLVTPDQPLEGRKIAHSRDLQEALGDDGEFDAILCLFSLHYEPRWLFVLGQLFNKLKDDGPFFLAEDRGVRAIFDNGNVETGTVDGKVRDQNSDLYNFVRNAFAERELRDWAAPWFPDISASDYSLVMQVLSVVADRAGEQEYPLQRKMTPDEPSCYLPWKPCFANGRNLRVQFQNMPRPEKVQEVAKISCFTKLRNFPDLHDLDDYLTRAIWNLVSLRAERNVSRILVSLSRSWGSDRDAMVKHFSDSFLRTAYLNIFRHFEAVIYAEVALGLLNWDLVSDYKSDGEMVEELLPAVFSPGRKLNLTFTQPAELSDYKNRVRDRNLPWLGVVLSARHQPGLYFWHQDCRNFPPEQIKKLRARIPELRFIEEGTDLDNEYQKRDPPPHLYLLEPLGRLESVSPPTDAAHALLGAGIVYFSAKYSPELGCLFYILRSVMPSVVGRSAFIETLLHRKEAETSRKIQEKLDTIQSHLGHLQAVTDEVKSIQILLHPDDSWTPGQGRLDELADIINNEVFQKGEHEIYRMPILQLQSALQRKDVQRLQQQFVADLRNARLPPPLVDHLFDLWQPEILASSSLDALCFARTIRTPGFFPAHWFARVPNLMGQIPAKYYVKCPDTFPRTKLLSAICKFASSLGDDSNLVIKKEGTRTQLSFCGRVAKDTNPDRSVDILVRNLEDIRAGKRAKEDLNGGKMTQILEAFWLTRGTNGDVCIVPRDDDLTFDIIVSLSLGSHQLAPKS